MILVLHRKNYMPKKIHLLRKFMWKPKIMHIGAFQVLSVEWCHQAKIPGISGHLDKAQTTRNNIFSWYHQNLIIYI